MVNVSRKKDNNEGNNNSEGNNNNEDNNKNEDNNNKDTSINYVNLNDSKKHIQEERKENISLSQSKLITDKKVYKKIKLNNSRK
jgi:hypothetical protein